MEVQMPTGQQWSMVQLPMVTHMNIITIIIIIIIVIIIVIIIIIIIIIVMIIIIIFNFFNSIGTCIAGYTGSPSRVCNAGSSGSVGSWSTTISGSCQSMVGEYLFFLLI